MNTRCIALAMLLVAPIAVAADKDVLRDACSALKSSAKRSACFDAIESTSTGNAAPSTKKQQSKKSPADKKIDDAQLKVRGLLRDPDSARFTGVAVSPASGAVCGVVTAKNAMGGYGDPVRYIVTDDFARIDGSDKWKMDYRWSELCGDI